MCQTGDDIAPDMPPVIGYQVPKTGPATPGQFVMVPSDNGQSLAVEASDRPIEVS